MPVRWRAAAEIESLREATWRPIETAPKDEGPLLLFCPGLEGHVADEIAKLPQRHSDLRDLFKSLPNSQDQEAYERLLADEALRERFGIEHVALQVVRAPLTEACDIQPRSKGR